MNKNSIAILTACLAGVVQASDYHVELDAAYIDGDDYEAFGGALTGYLNFVGEGRGVSLDSGAYSESGFLSRASSLSFSYVELDPDSDLDSRVDVTGANISIVYGEGGIFEFLGSTSDNIDTYSVAFGTYWGENSATVVRITNIQIEDTELGSTLNAADSDPLLVEIDTHSYVALGNGDRALSYDVTLGWVTADVPDSSGDSQTEFSPLIGGAITYYPTRNIGFGVSANWNDIAGADVFTYSAGAEVFITPRLGISTSYSAQEVGSGVGNVNETWTISLTGRI